MAELSLLVKATVVLAVALTVSRAARSAPASVRALVLASALGVLVLLPAVALLVPPRAVVLPLDSVAPSLFMAESLPAAPLAAPLPPPEAEAAVTTLAVTMPPLAEALRGVWIVGSLIACVPLAAAVVRLRRVRRRGVRWQEVDAMAAAVARAARVDRHVTVILSAELATPMTWGLVRPVIALPIDTPTWRRSDLEQALVHEMEHVRRLDWPVHLLARVACSVYWFHPLVWAVWRAFRLECERACDDAVVRRADGTVYAEQLIALARRLTRHTSQPLLSMAAESNLAARVNAVLDSGRRRGRAGIACAAAIVGAALAVMLVLSPLQASSRTQAPAEPQAIASISAEPALRFGITSVRPHDPTDRTRGFGYTLETGRLRLRNQTLRTIISVAYSQPFGLWFPDERISGGPEWMNQERYTIEARAERAVSAAEMGTMLRSLLAERFRLAVRIEARLQPVYALVSARSDHQLGPELRRSEVDCRTAARCGIGGGAGRYQLSGSTMALLAGSLTELTGRPVVDRTGLEGTFDGTLTWRPAPEELGAFGEPAPKAPSSEFGASLFTALQEQFGLRLEAERGPVEFLIVEAAERPRPNDATDSAADPPQTSPSAPAFEVTSVRRNTSGAVGARQQFTEGRFTATNTTLQLLLQDAYRMQVFQMAGGPEWLGTARFDIAATIPPNTPPEQRPLMLRALLAERFNLRVHTETRELPIFALVATQPDGRLGPNLNVSAQDCAAVAKGGPLRAPVTKLEADGTPACGMTMGPARIRAGGATMPQLANALAQFARRPVVDRTGLAGFFDFDLRYTPPARGTPPPDTLADDRPSIFTAVQEQLGLRLDATRGPVEVLVIDRVDMPTDN